MSEAAVEQKHWIKPLPKNVINKIAAGEVVERPASVIKELVENAIDAGAGKIDIIIEKSGAKLIKIVDDGCGIDENQIEIAFSRHATSKIANFKDLDTLTSYGFRGEALPSIASVSRLRMASRTADSKAGTEIIFEGGVLQTKAPCSSQVGTTIEVENLFYNTPARRKFLKSEMTESRHLSRMAMAMAISNYDVGFATTLNGRRLFSLSAGGTLTDRVKSLLGGQNRFLTVDGQMGPVRLQGCIGTPDIVRNNRYGQFLFINGRFITSNTISHAWATGYGELIPKGRFPVGALLLDIDPTQIDVNVHPSKTEVRLSHEREVYDAVRKLVAEALRQDGVIPSLKTRTRFSPGFSTSSGIRPASSGKSDGYIPGIAQSAQSDPALIAQLYKQDVETIKQTGKDGKLTINKKTGEILGENSERASEEELIAGGPTSGFRLIGRFSNLYLLLEAGNSLYIVDQHTAHERVLYEDTLQKVERQAVDGQSLLFPVQIELDPEQFAVFEDALQLLNDSGFAVAPFGGRMVNVEAVPSIMSRKSPELMFTKVLDDIASLRKTGYDQKKAIAQSIACRSAVMAGDRLSDAEAVGLLEQLLKCTEKYSCPHGRPTFIKFSRAELDRQFGRG